MDWTDWFHLRTVYETGYLNAEIVPVDCEGCEEAVFLITVGRRLIFLTWRLEMLASTAPDSSEDQDIEPETWPSSDVLGDIALALRMYFGEDDIANRGTYDLQRVIAESSVDIATVFLAVQRATDAQLFVLFHELMHGLDELAGDDIRELPHSQTVKEIIPRDYPATWKTEMTMDLRALQLLAEVKSIAAGADSPALGRAAIGADATLHCMRFLEQITGETKDESSRHPPADERRSAVQKTLDSDSAAEVQRIGALRQDMFDAFVNSRGDVLAEIRDLA